MQAGGVAGKQPKAPMVDPDGAFTKVQERTLGPFMKSKMTAKKGAKIVTKAKNGTSLGMKSVKAGYDKNPGVTRADFVTIGKQKSGKAMYGKTMKAKSGAKMPMKKMMGGGKCKNGC